MSFFRQDFNSGFEWAHAEATRRADETGQAFYICLIDCNGQRLHVVAKSVEDEQAEYVLEKVNPRS